jgi:hypothetical protein
MRERQARLDFIRSQISRLTVKRNFIYNKVDKRSWPTNWTYAVNNPDEREVEIENPPSYEAPPDYAEIAKIAQMEK